MNHSEDLRKANRMGDPEIVEETEYEYFIDGFDSYTRQRILARAAGFGGEIAREIFMLRKPVEKSSSLADKAGLDN